MTESKNTDVPALSFEEALKQLEAIIAKLESGDVALDESIGLYERGAALRSHCEAQLAAARERIETIVESKDGKITVEAVSFD